MYPYRKVLPKNLTSVHTVTRDSVYHPIWKHMRRSTSERSRTRVISVERVSLLQ